MKTQTSMSLWLALSVLLLAINVPSLPALKMSLKLNRFWPWKQLSFRDRAPYTSVIGTGTGTTADNTFTPFEVRFAGDTNKRLTFIS
jgi:hypothetical protein